MQTEYKTCPKCKETKPRSEFYVDKVTSDGLHYCCKSCKKAYERQCYKLNPEKRKAYQRTRKPELCLVTNAKCRSKKKSLPFDLNPADIVIPTHCPLLGIELKPGKGKMHDNSPTLDRIDPKGGYTADNVWVISFRANAIKNDASPEELIHIGIVLSNLYPHLSADAPN